MQSFNAAITSAIDRLLTPVAGSPPAALLIVSVVTGIVMTIVFRFTSRQAALRAASDRTKAMLLGMRLFNNDLRTALRYQGGLLKATGARLVHSLPPMIVLIIPILLLLVQLAHRFEWRALEIGEQAVASIEIAEDAWDEWREATIEPPGGVVVETPALRDEQRHSMHWRLRVDAAPASSIRWRVGDVVVAKRIVAAAETARLVAVSPERTSAGFIGAALHPVEGGLAGDSPVKRIEITYPARETPMLGMSIPWWATFLIVSLVTALIVRPIFRVQF
ncbi:MAG: hypothetical protein SYC29_15125 [Planctomycetota bacterium]|nr:hypothetical protein [Planctomycetota bacterium]